MSPDVDSSKDFCTSVFGWDAEDQFDDDGNRVYVMFTLDGKSVAGLGGQPPSMDNMPPVWNSYISSDDPGAIAEHLTAAGGTAVMPPDVPDMVPNHWAVYFTITDAEASVGAATAAGGQVVNGPMVIPGVGTIATLHDPAGGNFNLMKPEG